METARADAWLWAVRIFPTRSAATAACRGGKVRVGGTAAKPAARLRVGDRVEAFAGRQRIVEVRTLIEKRVGAAVAAACYVDHSPPPPPRVPRFPARERGLGRPTKRERRALDRVRGGRSGGEA